MITLTEIYEELFELGVVDTQSEFSEFCGRKPSWYSSTIARGRHPNIDVLYRLTWALHDTYLASIQAMEETSNNDEHKAFEAGVDVLEAIMGRVQDEMDRLCES
ncbi:DUF6626 family protein [Magnetovibrio blakemorei]|uniref:Uncharacterized protein n=1 Tax=Magnetovibrio blakemorei TaxID=28181 RepID=A0A1E5Q4T4_9PROT|nr:DUF6626 family protein [Magnetovibrio blakemorei]OEJ64573.1 hypothetical protein BEN30_16220 [Magnetovibrio blakemorei]